MIPLHQQVIKSLVIGPSVALWIAVSTEAPIPVLDVIQVYGRLATRDCYGRLAPAGSSCQIPKDSMKASLGLIPGHNQISREDFVSRLEAMAFEWPLKPYGIDKSLEKTALMNKGAETKVYMDELEARGLYDRHNPTGPLPTSLRPQLNRNLQQKPLDTPTADKVFQSISRSNKNRKLSEADVDAWFDGREAVDYYDFLKLIGTDDIKWPN